MSDNWHYRESRALLAQLTKDHPNVPITDAIAVAQVHATLAQVEATEQLAKAFASTYVIREDKEI